MSSPQEPDRDRLGEPPRTDRAPAAEPAPDEPTSLTPTRFRSDEPSTSFGGTDSGVRTVKNDRPRTDLTGVEQPPPPGPREYPEVPGYEILSELGRGGMGVVYQARDRRLNRLVALKMILRGDQARDEEVQRFLAEAEAVAQLRHPAIVQLYELGEWRPGGGPVGMPYLALEWCDGGTLAAKLGGRPLPARTAARLAEELAAAMHFAHAHGIVHRDLKPANVLLHDGQPKVSDFGLARWLHKDSGLTQDVAILGTPSYMAPEQAGGAKQAGPAADVYSLGAILYEMLTGRPPFVADTPLQTLRLVEKSELAPPSQVRSAVPRDLETICLKCLQKEPHRRYASAAELAEDLRRFQAGEPIRARPVGPGERLRLWARRNPALAGLYALAVVAALVVPALWVSIQARLSRSQEQQNEALREAAQAKELQAAAEQLAATQQYYSLLSGVRQRAADAELGWTWANERDLRRAARLRPEGVGLLDLRNETAALVGAVDLRESQTVAEGIYASIVAFTPDGKNIVVAQSKAQAWVTCFVGFYDAVSGRPGRVLSFAAAFLRNKAGDPAQDGPRRLCFSPDGRWLFVGARSGWLHRWDLHQPDPKVYSWKGHDAEVTGLELSPDGRWLYSAADDRRVRCWEATGGDKPVAEYTAPQPLNGLALSAGDLIAASNGPTVRLGADGLRPAGAARPPDGVSCLCGPGLGGLLAGAWWGGRLFLFPADLMSAPRELRDFELGAAFSEPVRALAWHPQQPIVAAVAANGMLKLFDAASGRLLASSFPRDPRSVAFSPDGRLLAVASEHRTILYDVAGLREQAFLAPHLGPVKDLAVGPDGHELLCLSFREKGGQGAPFQAILSLAEPGRGTARTIRSFDTSDDAGRVAWPGGNRVAYAARSPGTEALGIANSNGAGTRLAKIDARQMAFGRDGGTLWLVQGQDLVGMTFPEGKEVGRWNNGLAAGLSGLGALASIAAGTQWLAVGGQDGGVRLFSTEPFRLAATAPGKGAEVPAVTIDAAETQVAAGGDDGRLRLIALPTGTVLTDIEAHRGAIHSVAFSPDGTLLASGANDRTVRLWRCGDGTLEPLLTLRLPAPVLKVAFADGGRRLVALVRNEWALRVWDIPALRQRLAELGLDWR